MYYTTASENGGDLLKLVQKSNQSAFIFQRALENKSWDLIGSLGKCSTFSLH